MKENEYKGEIMSWGQCERDFMRKVEIDNERIKSIMIKSELRLKRAVNTEVNKETISFIVEDYYEVIKELLTAYLLKNGLRSKNHQCLISYFYKENREYEREAYIIQQMSFYRNRLSYYGEDIPMNFYLDNKDEFERIIEIVKKLIKS